MLRLRYRLPAVYIVAEADEDDVTCASSDDLAGCISCSDGIAAGGVYCLFLRQWRGAVDRR